MGSGRYPDEVLRLMLQAQQEKVAFAAAHGGKIGLGSDAGAYLVPHEHAAQDEYAYLKAALGEETEKFLQKAEAFANARFRR